MSGPSTNTSATPGLNLTAFAAWLEVAHPELAGGPLTAMLLTGGRSNLTYRVDGATRPLVVRRPPLGGALPTAHDMRREHRVMTALAGTAVPVPEMIDLVDDADAGSITGSTFLVAEFVDGAVLSRRRDNAAFPPAGLRELSHELARTLAVLHAIEPAAVGLADFGRSDGYARRQVDRWQRQWQALRTRPLPELDELAARLAATAPESSRAAIVHGDYRLDNVIVAADSDRPRIAAVLDWEMATLGDPLVDLGLLGLYWSAAQLPGAGALLPTAVDEGSGYPPFDELVDVYADAAGIPAPALGWYRAFADFKLAVIAEDVYARYRAGHMADEGVGSIEPLVDALVADGRRRLPEGV